MSSSAAASTEEFIEVLNAEQHVEIQKLRDYARHGVQPAVRGEVWLYLLGVLSDDKSQEMTSVRSKYMEYDSLEKHNLLYEKRIRNEAVRYYQRKLIPRPLPGRTLARSSQRVVTQNRKTIGGTSYAPNETTIALTTPSVAVPALNTIVTTSATTRGPNRVNDGKTKVLAGIMGDSSEGTVSHNSVNSLTGDESDILIDPEAAAANEMKRFCRAVENIVCAHLNRWKWRSIDGTVTIVESDKTAEVDSRDHSEDAISSSNHKDHLSIWDQQQAQHQDLNQSVSPQSSSSQKPLPEKGKRDRASTVSSTVSSTSSSSSSLEENKETAHDTTQDSAFPSLPREYEWAHQGLKESLKTSGLIGNTNGPSGEMNGITNGRSSSQGCFVQTEYHPDLILLCSPFVKCVRSEPGMFFAFEKLMSIIGK